MKSKHRERRFSYSILDKNKTLAFDAKFTENFDSLDVEYQKISRWRIKLKNDRHEDIQRTFRWFFHDFIPRSERKSKPMENYKNTSLNKINIVVKYRNALRFEMKWKHRKKRFSYSILAKNETLDREYNTKTPEISSRVYPKYRILKNSSMGNKIRERSPWRYSKNISRSLPNFFPWSKRKWKPVKKRSTDILNSDEIRQSETKAVAKMKKKREDKRKMENEIKKVDFKIFQPDPANAMDAGTIPKQFG